MQQPNRIDPMMPAQAYRTYELRRPEKTHYREATCAEVECEHWRDGWVTRIDTSSDLGVRQANYIGNRSGRYYTAKLEGSIITFTFPAGQQCFTMHRVPLEREPLYIVRGGDWRGNPLGENRVHKRGADWVDDFATHQQTLSDEIGRG